MASSHRASAASSSAATLARRLFNSLIGKFANSVGAFAGSNIARSIAEHCAASLALAASASAAAFLRARASSRALAAVLRSCRCCFGFSAGGTSSPENKVDVIVDAAGVLSRAAVIDEYQPVCRKLDHVPVVTDDDHGALVTVQRLNERLARIHVQVVRRFVENQQVRRIPRDQGQCQPGGSPPESLPTSVVALSPEKPKRPSCALIALGVLPVMARVMCWSGVSSPCSSSTWY